VVIYSQPVIAGLALGPVMILGSFVGATLSDLIVMCQYTAM